MADHQITAQAALYQCKSCEGHFVADAFYASNAARCKECVKASVRANREQNLDYYQSYDRLRYRDQDHRKESARRSAASPAGVASRAKSQARNKAENPEKWVARNTVNNSLRDGKITRASECFFCSATGKLQAHHHDYSRPLDIFWLCPKCHGKLHTVNGDFHRPRKPREVGRHD